MSEHQRDMSREQPDGHIDRARLWKLIAETEREIVDLERRLKSLASRKREEAGFQGAERRAHRRWNLARAVKLILPDGRETEAQVQEISQGGLRLAVRARLRNQEPVRVTMERNDGGGIVLHGQVRWVEPEAAGCTLGLMFQDLSLEGRSLVSRLISQAATVAALEEHDRGHH